MYGEPCVVSRGSILLWPRSTVWFKDDGGFVDVPAVVLLRSGEELTIRSGSTGVIYLGTVAGGDSVNGRVRLSRLVRADGQESN